VHQIRIFIDAGIPPAVATAIPSAFGIALIVARLGTGWLLDRVRATIIMPVFLIGGMAAALLYAYTPTAREAVVGAILAGLIVGAEFDVLSYMIPRYHGRKAFGKIAGSIFAVFQLGSAIGVFAVGAARAQTGSYTTPMLIVGGLCLLCAISFPFMGAYRYAPGKTH